MFKIFGFKISKVVERVLIVVGVIVITAVVVKATDNKANRDAVSGLQDGCPADMVFVPSSSGPLCVDKYEASASDKCPYVSPNTQDETRVNLDFKDCRPVSVVGTSPWVNISQDQARIACAKAGKRLATQKEWMSAALGTPDKETGWGSDDCNVESNWARNPGLTGSAKDCISASGAYDMIGNVWEWVDSSAVDGVIGSTTLPEAGFVKSVDDQGLPSATDRENPDKNFYNDFFWIKKSGVRGMARGGYWKNGEEAGQYAIYGDIDPAFAGVGIGFRCVK